MFELIDYCLLLNRQPLISMQLADPETSSICVLEVTMLPDN